MGKNNVAHVLYVLHTNVLIIYVSVLLTCIANCMKNRFYVYVISKRGNLIISIISCVMNPLCTYIVRLTTNQ